MPANFAHPNFWDRRPGESDIGFQMRLRPYLAHREDAQAEADQGHAEFRQHQEARSTGTGIGLAGDLSPQQRATAIGGRGHGSGRELERNGHLLGGVSTPGQRSVPRVWAGDIDSDGQAGVSPLTMWLRGQR